MSGRLRKSLSPSDECARGEQAMMSFAATETLTKMSLIACLDMLMAYTCILVAAPSLHILEPSSYTGHDSNDRLAGI